MSRLLPGTSQCRTCDGSGRIVAILGDQSLPPVGCPDCGGDDESAGSGRLCRCGAPADSIGQCRVTERPCATCYGRCDRCEGEADTFGFGVDAPLCHECVAHYAAEDGAP